MMARTLSSLSAASNASISSCCMVPLKALSLSGRFSVMVRICSATSYLIVSYAMGGFLPLCFLFDLRCAVIPGRERRRRCPESMTLDRQDEFRACASASARHDGLESTSSAAPATAFAAPRRPSNALAMPSTPRSSKRRPTICTPIGKPLLVVAAIDRDGRVLRHVPRHGVADVLERLCGIVERGGEFGREVHHRRYRRDHIIEIAEQFCGRGADRHGLR